MVAVAACPTSPTGAGVTSSVSLAEVRGWLDMIPTCSGEDWYVVCEDWFSYFVSGFPGLTDNQFAPKRPEEVVGNNRLIDENGRIRRDLIMDMDYRIVPKDCWDYLLARFDLTSRRDQHELKVPIIQDGDALGPELYQYEVTMQREHSADSFTKTFSRTTTLATIEECMRAKFEIDEKKETYLRLQPMAECEWMPVEDKSVTLLDSGASESAVLVIGLVGESEPAMQGPMIGPQLPFDSHNGFGNGSLDMDTSPLSPGAQPLPDAPSSSRALLPYTGPPQAIAPRPPSPPPPPSALPLPPPPGADAAPCGPVFGPRLPEGQCGLPNLGATCYLSSALQCLSNARPLAEFFIKDEWQRDLNADNPDGLGGDMARQFAGLLRRLWSGEASELPVEEVRAFKAVVERKDRSFVRAGEQDAQELLSAVLDGLHEDLLRPKPAAEGATEPAEAAGGPLEPRSRIVELVHGCLQSSVECAACGELRETREPFQLLQLPLLVDVTVVRAGAPNIAGSVRVPAGCHVGAMLEEAAAELETAAERLWAARIKDFAFSEEMHHGDSLDSPSDIFVFERPARKVAASNGDEAAMEHSKEESVIENGNGNGVVENENGFHVLKNGNGDSLMENGNGDVVMENGEEVTVTKNGNDSASKNGKDVMENGGDDSEKENDKDAAMEVGQDGVPMEEERNGSIVNDQQTMEDSTPEDPKVAMIAALKERRCPVVVIEVATSEDGPEPKLVALPVVFFAEPGQRSVRTSDLLAFARDQLAARADAESVEVALRLRSGSDLQSPGEEIELRREGPVRLVALCAAPEAVRGFGSRSGPRPALSVTDCLERFTRREELAGAEAVECERCRRKQRAFRAIDFVRLPEVLIMQLKRVTIAGKLKIPVKVPTESLDLGPWSRGAGSGLYDLVAVSHHHGVRSDKGHYSTLAKNWKSNRWFCFNDEKVTEQQCCPDPNDAYILIYVRQENAVPMETESA